MNSPVAAHTRSQDLNEICFQCDTVRTPFRIKNISQECGTVWTRSYCSQCWTVQVNSYQMHYFTRDMYIFQIVYRGGLINLDDQRTYDTYAVPSIKKEAIAQIVNKFNKL
jgi:hypothetical protein